MEGIFQMRHGIHCSRSLINLSGTSSPKNFFIVKCTKLFLFHAVRHNEREIQCSPTGNIIVAGVHKMKFLCEV